jgi:hypothetical protein
MARPTMRTESNRDQIPDLSTQFETLLDTVCWRERLWTLEDRIERQLVASKRESRSTHSDWDEPTGAWHEPVHL